MPPLKTIEVHGYKSIKQMVLDLKPLNVLIGANGSGKSNFISIFGLLHDIIAERLQLHVGRAGGAESLLHFGQKATPEMSIRLTFALNSYFAKLVPSKRNSVVFAEEEVLYHGYGYTKPFDIPLGAGHE